MFRLSVIACLSFVLSAHANGLKPVPETRAPFFYSGAARQAVELLTWQYRPWAFAGADFRTWAEFKSGDRSVLVNGEERRLRKIGSGAGAQSMVGFGRIGVMAGKRSATKPAEKLVWEIHLRCAEGNTACRAAETNDVLDVCTEKKEVRWSRRMGGAAYRYEVKSVGPGRVDVVYDRELKVKIVRRDEVQGISVSDNPPEGGRRGRIVIDLGEAAVAKVAPTPPAGGIDFWQLDALHVPIRPGRNLLPNGGFEQGWKGWIGNIRGPMWKSLVKVSRDGRLNEIVPEGRRGGRAMRFRRIDGEAEAIYSMPVPLVAGKSYVLSYWIKGKSALNLCVGVNPPSREDAWKFRKTGSSKGTTGSDGWMRRSMTFVPEKSGAMVYMFAWMPCDALIDDIRIEEGEVPSEADDEPVQACLKTGHANNLIAKGCRIGACVELRGKSGESGTLQVSVRNFYSEELFRERIGYVLGKDGRETAELGFDRTISESGVYIVRFDFSEAGRTWTDYARFAVIDPVGVDHPSAGFFCTYGWFERGSRAKELLQLSRDMGWGAASWMVNAHFNDEVTGAMWKESGRRPYLHAVSTELACYYPDDFGWRKPNFRDYTNVVPEKVALIEDAAYRAGKDCRADDVWWTLGNEEELSFPVIKNYRDFDTWAVYQYAAYRGLKRAFDERGLKFYYAPTHGTCNAGRGEKGGIALQESYIRAAEKLGFKYDFLSFHHYWAFDGSDLASWSDRDENSQAIEEMMSRTGMEGKPYLFSESFNLTPMYIPEWNASDWHDYYYGTAPSQDLGNREFVHAALMARMYLIDLKRYPRLMTVHNWMKRPAMDFSMTLYAWPFVANTLGRLLPDPRFAGEYRPIPSVRGYVYRAEAGGRAGVLAVWTTDRDVENGLKSGPCLALDVRNARFYDLMGAERRAERTADGICRIPLTSAPLFITADDVEALLAAYKRSAMSGQLPTDERKSKSVEIKSVRFDDGATVDWSKINEVAPGVRLAWNRRVLRVRLEGENSRCVRLGIDGLGNARDVRGGRLGPDDSVYEFNGAAIKRLKCVNTQFADGTTSAASDDEVIRDFKRRFTANDTGGVWELEISPRFLTPTRLEAGTKFALGAVFARNGNEPVLRAPETWPLLVLTGGK